MVLHVLDLNQHKFYKDLAPNFLDVDAPENLISPADTDLTQYEDILPSSDVHCSYFLWI